MSGEELQSVVGSSVTTPKQIAWELSLDSAETLINKALQEARARQFSALAVAIVDSGGNLIAYRREDGCGPLRFNISVGKAKGAIGFGMHSRHIQQVVEQRQHFASAVAVASDGGFVPVAGGVLLFNADRTRVIGAIGISGDTSDNDEHCACVAARFAGFLD